ncbi:MAG: SRPBCC family protein [Pseudomonadales bacterium]
MLERVLRNMLVILLLACPAAAWSEVTDANAHGFTSSIQLMIAATPERVYRALVHEVGRWWDPSHSYSGKAENLYIEAKPGGCFCERMAANGGVEHMRVVLLQPGKQLRLSGGLGPLQSVAAAGSMDFLLKRAGKSSTQLNYTYVVGGYRSGGLKEWSAVVDGVQAGQLQRLKSYVETGSPVGGQN